MTLSMFGLRKSCRWLLSVVVAMHVARGLAQEPPHPILTISGSGSGASTVLSTWPDEFIYRTNFVPRQSPRNDSYGFAAPVVSGDTSWSWSSSTPNQITSTPSGTVFPTTLLYQVKTQNVS